MNDDKEITLRSHDFEIVEQEEAFTTWALTKQMQAHANAFAIIAEALQKAVDGRK